MEALKQFELDEYADHYPDALVVCAKELAFAHIYVKTDYAP